MATFTDGFDFRGTVNMASASNVFYKAASVQNASLAITPIHMYGTSWGFGIDDTPTAKDWPVLICRAAGTIDFVYFALMDTGTNTDIDFQCDKNETTVLSAAVNIVHGDSDRENKAGSLSVTTVAAGDIISMAIETVTQSTGAQGPIGLIGITWTATAS